eukprot:gb/GECG01004690.1/.p1 GENE.gb/GECG01004690.1/~~gb/GECG01004690.1/.p1  ORF type:complete len:751 (+),score=86.39 gb/GECG01004690.1/:1-2253(+)
MEQRWRVHAYKRPDVSLARVAVHAVYAVPKDVDTLPEAAWVRVQRQILNECREFHHRIFHHCSEMRWFLHGPLRLPRTCSQYDRPEHVDNPEDDRAFWGVLVDDVKEAMDHPPDRGMQIVETSSGIDEGSSSSSEPWIPTHVETVIFVEYGTETVDDWTGASTPHLRGSAPNSNGGSSQEASASSFSKKLSKYFVARNNTACGIHADLTDIKRTGGSAACFLGTIPFRKMHMLWNLNEETRMLIPDDSCSDLPVGFGVGVITEEGWRHPEIPGSASVAYHEGCGHAIDMPHPTRRHPKGVMDVAQYHGTHLSEHHIAWEILNEMWSANDGTAAGCALEQDINPLLSLGLEECEGCREDRRVCGQSKEESTMGSGVLQVLNSLGSQCGHYVGHDATIVTRCLQSAIAFIFVDDTTVTKMMIPENVKNPHSKEYWVYSPHDSSDPGYLRRYVESVLILRKHRSHVTLVLIPSVKWAECQFGPTTDVTEKASGKMNCDRETANSTSGRMQELLINHLSRYQLPVYGNDMFHFEELFSSFLRNQGGQQKNSEGFDDDSIVGNTVVIGDRTRGLQIRLPHADPRTIFRIGSSGDLGSYDLESHEDIAYIRPYDPLTCDDSSVPSEIDSCVDQVTSSSASTHEIPAATIRTCIRQAVDGLGEDNVVGGLRSVPTDCEKASIVIAASKSNVLVQLMRLLEFYRPEEWGFATNPSCSLSSPDGHAWQHFRKGFWASSRRASDTGTGSGCTTGGSASSD